MEMKLLIASIGALGVVSTPVIAATQTTTTSTTTHKHTHHHVVVYHHAHIHHHVAQNHEYKGYKDAGELPVVAIIDTHQLIYDAMSQNIGRSQGLPDWFNRISLSGGVNFDAHWGNLSQGFMGENTFRVSLNDAYINAAAIVNDWSKAFVSLSYSEFSAHSPVYDGTYSAAYTDAVLNLEQGYLTIANYDVSPFFFQVGKQFTDYGRYTIHPLERSMTQVMTESLATSAKLGFISISGLHGDIYAFENPFIQVGKGHSNSIYGAALGFDQLNDQLGFDLGIGYMSNLIGVNDIASAIGNPGFAPTLTYIHPVGGVAVYGDLNTGPLTFSIRYTTAVSKFNPLDISNVFGSLTAGGAKPWAAEFISGFGFNRWNHNQIVYLGFQTSKNAVNLSLPKKRLVLGYDIDMWRNTTLGAEIGHDKAYGSGHGGFGRSTNTIGARASVKFG